MAPNFEADFNFLMRVLSHLPPIEPDWYAIAGTARGAAPNSRVKASNTSHLRRTKIDMTPEETLSFYHLVLKHSDLTADYYAVGAEYYGVEKATKPQKDRV
ncbi:hypothetical protein OHC33_007714 [Knufia fluminis]|uniref:Uncharacterized protein n=2 Tax=Knufia TaxID=430999 RepID=A0AAN8F4S7_9EURO|nr:hypothetical protein OHC33_007714 [Knufia fluminis]